MTICPGCSKELENPFFCKNCDRIVESEELPDYFSTLNIPPNFNPDMDLAESNYEDFLMEVHPDFIFSEDPRQKSLGLKYSSHLKTARDRLRIPYDRAIHLMKIVFGETPSEQDLKVPADFLVTVFDLQEKIETGEVDEETRFGTLARLEETLQQMGDLFTKAMENPSSEYYEKLTDHLAQLKFFQNLKEKLDSHL